MVGHRPPVIWSPEALDDVDRLWDYYAHIAGPATADKIIREIAKVVKVIDDFPSAGRARDEIRTGLRSLAATPQIVFYRLNDDRPEVVCVCLMGGRILRKFFPMTRVVSRMRAG